MAKRPTALKIPRSILNQAYRQARRSFPNECCGWLSGSRDSDEVSRIRECVNAQSSGNHPTKPSRTAEIAYVFTSTDLIDLYHSLDTKMPARIIFHSHPNGRAYLSPTDRQVATSPWGDGPVYPVQQLVIGIDGDQIVEAALFSWSDEDLDFIEVDRYDGAHI
ncbi:hypothetical protein FIM12_01610 [SAR202 cluster bacterium AD-804-J14_MRT_500m]|nr:hypothetical protein [SAR202 cluster bacterium AD-804-J14_MRT_500m]